MTYADECLERMNKDKPYLVNHHQYELLQGSLKDIAELVRRLHYACEQLRIIENGVQRNMPIHHDYIKGVLDELEAIPEDK